MDPFEDAEWQIARTILARRGFVVPARESVGEHETRGRLWELIYAMAGTRFYLSCTDHLSDRELHDWLHENWLDEATADLPPDAKWNTRISPVCACDEEEGTILWLRYYADEEERQLMAEKCCASAIPPHEDPGHDRDRHLPNGTACVAEECGVDCMDCEELTDEDLESLQEITAEEDPLGLHAVDAEIRANREEQLMEELSSSDSGFNEQWRRPLEMMQRKGVCLLPPDEHTDDSIGAGLWEMLHELDCLGFYVEHTDHLSDRELYLTLWRDILREPAMLSEDGDTSVWYHDFSGCGTAESEQVRLRFYASESERADALRENPQLVLPPHQDLVASRDWRLPKGPA